MGPVTPPGAVRGHVAPAPGPSAHARCQPAVVDLGPLEPSAWGMWPSCPQHTEVTNPRLGSLWTLRGVTACCGDPADLTGSQAQGGRISPLARSMFANTPICDLDACPPNPSSWRSAIMGVPSCAGTTCRRDCRQVSLRQFLRAVCFCMLVLLGVILPCGIPPKP